MTGGRRMKRRRMYITIMALWGATAASSVQRRVWARSQSRVWWDGDVNGFSETDVTQNFRITRVTFYHNV